MDGSELDSMSDALVSVSTTFPAPLASHCSSGLCIAGPCLILVNDKKGQRAKGLRVKGIEFEKKKQRRKEETRRKESVHLTSDDSMAAELGTGVTLILAQGEAGAQAVLSRRCCSRAASLRKVRPQPHLMMDISDDGVRRLGASGAIVFKIGTARESRQNMFLWCWTELCIVREAGKSNDEIPPAQKER